VLVLITGERNVGKTTVVRRLVAGLADRDLSLSGFYTAGGPETLELVAVGTGERIRFADQGDTIVTGQTVGRYTVDPAAIDRGMSWLQRPGEVLLLDEIGRLEARGDGFAAGLAAIQPAQYLGVVVAVRQGYETVVTEAFSEEVPIERFEVTESNRDALPTRIIEQLAVDDS
jgi:nucleoside-triphosphatase THEP1